MLRLGLAPAHDRKQRFIRDEETYKLAALLCQRHHYFAEHGDRDNPGTHERMKEIIQDLISRRGTYLDG